VSVPSLSQNLESFEIPGVSNFMSPISPDYGQQFLLPPALEDWLPRDHPVRFIREYVDQLKLEELGFEVSSGSEGRPPYAAGLLLKIWLYGYLNRLRSTRKLEAACREHIGLLWLTGLISPDHNTLWRFWRDNRKAIGNLFRHSAQLAAERGMVGLVLQALDATKIQAVASGRSGWTQKQMQELLASLDRELAEAEQQIEQAGAVEPGTEYRLPEDLQPKHALREMVKSGLQELDQSGRKHYHRHESQSRRMSCDGKNRFGYNAQALVDQKSGVVVAADVTNQENDIGQLAPMTQQAQDNVAGSDKANPVVVADSGYGCGADIAAAADKGLNVLVYPMEGASSKNKPYHAKHFVYEPQNDCVRCPRGEALVHERSRQINGQPVRIYRCHCSNCPVAKDCTKDPRGREITVGPHALAVQAMHRRLADTKEQERLRQRGQVVERFFGHLKEHEGFRRWTVRGLEAVKAQWAMLCCASNLRLTIKKWRAELV
jgi:transposase